MTRVHCHFRWAPRLAPATVASLVSLFAIAPAETMVNRFLHAPHPVRAPAPAQGEPAPEIVVITHHGPHEHPGMRLLRYAYKPETPRHDHDQPACADGPCFDPDGFEPAAGGVSGGDQGAGGTSFGIASPQESEPPSSPSQEAQFDAAGLGAFASGGDGNGNSGGGAGGGGSGGNAGGGGGSGGNGGNGGTSFVLLPGAGGSVSDGGTSETGGDGEPPSSSKGQTGGGGGGGSAGFVPGGSPEESGDEDSPLIETISLRVAPAAAPVEVSAPGTAVLLAAALAVLGLRRRSM